MLFLKRMERSSYKTGRTGVRLGPGLFILVLAAMAVGCQGPRRKMPSHDASAYRYPLKSPGTQFAELPPAVQRTIRAETGGTLIADIQKNGTDNDRMVYRVIFENQERFAPLYIAPDGSVLNPDLTVVIAAPHEAVATKTAGPSERLTLEDLPPQVVKAMQGQAPDAEVDTVVRETRGEKKTRSEQVIYHITFKDRKHPPLDLGPDGTILHEPPP